MGRGHGAPHGALLKAGSGTRNCHRRQRRPVERRPPSAACVCPSSVPHCQLVSPFPARPWSSLPARRTTPRSASLRSLPGGLCPGPLVAAVSGGWCTCPTTARPGCPPPAALPPTLLATWASYPAVQTQQSVASAEPASSLGIVSPVAGAQACCGPCRFTSRDFPE